MTSRCYNRWGKKQRENSKCDCRLGKKGLTSLLKEVRVFKESVSGSEKKKTMSHDSGKGRFESENAHFSTGHHRENGDFLPRNALVWGEGKWGVSDSETLFSWFWGFWPLYRVGGFAIITCMKLLLFKFFRVLQLKLSGVFRINWHYSYSFLGFLAECSYRIDFPSEILRNFLRLQLHDWIVFECKM